jgi:hypothetical protein
MIWGGQALRIFDDRLSASLSQIRNAKEALDNNIKQDEGQQHITLVREYMSILEGFDKHFSALSNVQVRIQLKIQHVIGLRDGVSSSVHQHLTDDFFENICLGNTNGL